MSPAVDREGSKWDRAARYLRVATVLHAHPEGISAVRPSRTRSASPSAPSIATSRRWSSTPSCPSGRTGGKWGLEAGAFLPPLALTLHEATTFFLACAGPRQGDRRARHGAPVGLRQAGRDPAAGARGAPPRDRGRLRHDAPQRALHARPAGAHPGVGRAARGRASSTARASTTLRQAARRTPGPAVRHRAVGAHPRAVPHRLRRGPAGRAGRSRSNGSWRRR